MVSLTGSVFAEGYLSRANVIDVVIERGARIFTRSTFFRFAKKVQSSGSGLAVSFPNIHRNRQAKA
jgi:hypothetical protein